MTVLNLTRLAPVRQNEARNTLEFIGVVGNTGGIHSHSVRGDLHVGRADVLPVNGLFEFHQELGSALAERVDREVSIERLQSVDVLDVDARVFQLAVNLDGGDC